MYNHSQELYDKEFQKKLEEYYTNMTHEETVEYIKDWMKRMAESEAKAMSWWMELPFAPTEDELTRSLLDVASWRKSLHNVPNQERLTDAEIEAIAHELFDGKTIKDFAA